MSIPKKKAKSSKVGKVKAKRAPKKKAKRAPGVTKPKVVNERRADHDLVDTTIDMLAAYDEATQKSVLELGLFVFDRFFDADEEAVRSKSPKKSLSFALLAERAEAETSWDATDLWKAVTAAIVYRSLPSQTRDRIPASTLERLGAIDDVEVRQRLAARMASGELVGEAAREAIAEANQRERAGGRSATPVLVRFVKTIARRMRAARESGAFGARARREVKGDARVRAREDLRELRDEIDELLRALED